MLYNSNAVPPRFTLRGIFVDGASSSRSQQQMHRPITIDTSRFAHPVENEDATRLGGQNRRVNHPPPEASGVAVVVWRPAPAVELLRAFPYFMECRCIALALAASKIGPPLTIDAMGIVHEEVDLQIWVQNSIPASPVMLEDELPESSAPVIPDLTPTDTLFLCASGPSNLEIQIEGIRPGPESSMGRADGNQAPQKRKDMLLPNLVSISDPRTPLTQTFVRRSTRLSSDKEGFRPVRIDKEPSKRSKNWVVEVDEVTGEIKPISTSILRGWGIQCGVDPSGLTDDALLQAPPPFVPDEDDEEQ